MNAKEMFEKLGYEERATNYCIYHSKKNKEINLWISPKVIECFEYNEEDERCVSSDITLQELQAINKQVEELGWLGSDDNE